MKHLLIITFVGLCIIGCNSQKEVEKKSRPQVEINTSRGTILVELYNETPEHRDNFIKLVNDGFYDNMLWHRVVDGYIIQTGDPSSYDALPSELIDSKGTGNLVPREVHDSLFHKRGALSAAHDGNPRFYSKSEFFIVQKGPVADSLFEEMENRINKELAFYHTFRADSNSELLAKTLKAYEEGDDLLYRQLYDSVKSMADQIENPDYYHFPKEHIKHYKELGGMPFADQLHTVFGEVVTGMDVVDSIAASKTDDNQRPVHDIKIISMRIKKDAKKE